MNIRIKGPIDGKDLTRILSALEKIVILGQTDFEFNSLSVEFRLDEDVAK